VWPVLQPALEKLLNAIRVHIPKVSKRACVYVWVGGRWARRTAASSASSAPHPRPLPSSRISGPNMRILQCKELCIPIMLLAWIPSLGSVRERVESALADVWTFPDGICPFKYLIVLPNSHIS
jgi:hypothetical protein